MIWLQYSSGVHLLMYLYHTQFKAPDVTHRGSVCEGTN